MTPGHCARALLFAISFAVAGCHVCEGWPQPRIEVAVSIDSSVQAGEGDYLHLRLLNPSGQSYTGYDRPFQSIDGFPFQHLLGNCDGTAQPSGTYTVIGWIGDGRSDVTEPGPDDPQGRATVDIECVAGECEHAGVDLLISPPQGAE